MKRISSLRINDPVEYIRWNYKVENQKDSDDKVHFIKLKTGESLIKTLKEMLEAGLVTRTLRSI